MTYPVCVSGVYATIKAYKNWPKLNQSKIIVP